MPMTITEQQLVYILPRCPQEFRGKDNWLGYKKTPHTPLVFINKITTEGVATNEGFKSWLEQPAEAIATIYQRLKINEVCTKP
jgi:hypothetical protein